MEYLTYADIYMFSLIMLIFLLVYFVINAPHQSPSKIIFIFIITTLMINLALVMLSCFPNGIDEPWAISMNKWTNSMLFVFAYLPITAWLAYVDYRTFNNFEKTLRRMIIYLAPFFLSFILVFINLFTGVLFTIESGNFYTRQAGVLVVTLIVYAELLVLFFIARSKRRQFNMRLIKIVFLFMLFPIAASLLEYLLPELRLLWPAFSFSTFMIFIVLEKDSMQKDALTKLSTRALLEKRVRQKLRRHEPFSLIMIDLDGFKQINDKYGHKTGDDALLVVASLLEDSVKRTDLVCRYGGDEFLLLIESARENAATYVTDRIKSKVSAFNKKKIKPYIIGMSFGLKFHNKSRTSIKKLMADVDALMYDDKKKNKKQSRHIYSAY